MNLQQELIKQMWHESSKGWRPLANNETRESSGPECSYKLFASKIYPAPDPKSVEPQLKQLEDDQKNFGIFCVQGASGVFGTFTHLKIQDMVKPLIESAEKKVTKTGKTTRRSGHVDMIYDDDVHGRVVCDIKSVSSMVFFYCINLKTTQDPESYSIKKRKESIIQANSYAVRENVEWYCILWVNRDNGMMFLEWFKADPAMDKDIDEKNEDIEAARQRYVAGDAMARPKFCGVHECMYCRHSAAYTDWDKSPFNCRGEDSAREWNQFQHFNIKPVETTLPVKRPELNGYDDRATGYPYKITTSNVVADGTELPGDPFRSMLERAVLRRGGE